MSWAQQMLARALLCRSRRDLSLYALDDYTVVRHVMAKLG